MSKASALAQTIAIGALLLVPAYAFWSWLGQHPAPVAIALPQGAAVFETSLQSRISSTDTSMSLVANSVRGGSSLSGYNCFTIDEGRSDMEYVCGTISGTSVTGLERGVDPLTASTTNSDLKFAHRVGANVKITDFPLIQRMRHQLSGSDTIANIIRYANNPTFASTSDIVTKKYVDDTAFSGAGVIDATTAARGVCELATQVEAASSTANGGSGVLCLPTSTATSTFNTATAALRLVMTQNNGKIDNYFIATSTLFTGQNFSVGTTTMTGSLTMSGLNSTSNIASSSIVAFTASTTPSTTWTKPANLKYVIVEVVGGGGGGAKSSGAGDSNHGGGGGGGGYGKKIIPASALGSTETVIVGMGGAGKTTTGTANSGIASSFGSHCSATGGSGGTDTNQVGGSGGLGSGCDINIRGSAGGSNHGGNSMLGGGGKGSSTNSGEGGGQYGGGGAGGGNSGNGGDGAVGAVIVTQYFF